MTRNRFRPEVERLEDRELPATANLTAGILTVLGTSSADNIGVTVSGGYIRTAGRSFAAGSVSKIVIAAAGGNDVVNISTSITKPTWVYGGWGNDTVYGGSGADRIWGGDGNDNLRGRGGNDVLWGGAGTDTLNGGAGSNALHQGSPTLTYSVNASEQQVVNLVNNERTSRGLSALTLNSRLSRAARIHAINMANRYRAVGFNALQHVLFGSLQPSPESRLDFVGYSSRGYGENIAAGYLTASSVMDAWMGSSGHRANILYADFTQIGVAYYDAFDGTRFWVQVFGIA